MVEVLRTKESPYAELASVEGEVKITGGFWKKHLETNSLISLHAQFEQCESSGRLDNFKRAAGENVPPPSSRVAPDSDVYKWVEAAAYAVANGDDQALEQKLSYVIDLIVNAQDDDGYINTVFIGERKPERFKDLLSNHELYCGGHLIQAALAHRRVTGNEQLLDAAVLFANHVCEYFGPGRHPGTCGHPEIEMALVELYRETRDKKYLDQAIFFIHERGKNPPLLEGRIYFQDHLPIEEQTEVTGHAVRQLYLMTGIADIYLETGEEKLLEVISQQWQDLNTKKVSITGGVGARHAGESFGLPYELPNRTAYNETCASIASFMFNWRMLQITGEPRFADVMEQALYNGILAGVSLDGVNYFYSNPLEHPGDDSSVRSFYGSNRRTQKMWDAVPCCPPNLARLLSSLDGYLYSQREKTLYLHFFAESEATFKIDDQQIKISQETNYPWDGEVKLKMENEEALQYEMAIRIPPWVSEARLLINGELLDTTVCVGEYLYLDRGWSDGDIVELKFDLPVRKMVSNPKITSNASSVALMRGPLVYCFEGIDQNDDLFNIFLSKDTSFVTSYAPELLGGVTILNGEAFVEPNEERLYYPISDTSVKRAEVVAIPYYAWANREQSSMRVWMPMKNPGV